MYLERLIDLFVCAVHGSKKFSNITQDRSGLFICSFILLVYLTKRTVDLNQKLGVLKACCSICTCVFDILYHICKLMMQEESLIFE